MDLSLLVAGTVPLRSCLVVSFLPATPGLPPGVELEGGDLQELARILFAPSDERVNVVSSEVVDLGVGPAVSRRRRLPAPVAADEPEHGTDRGEPGITSFDLEWLVPVPGLPGAFLMLAFAPVLPLEDGLIDLFDAVARTFHWVGQGAAGDATAREAEGPVGRPGLLAFSPAAPAAPARIAPRAARAPSPRRRRRSGAPSRRPGRRGPRPASPRSACPGRSGRSRRSPS